MKREIDIEKEITAGGGSGNQTRKKLFDEGKRQSETKVIDSSMWDVTADNPAALAKNHLYAAS